MSLQGGRELRARLRALHLSFKPIGKEWADDTVRRARATAPVRTGKLRASIRRRNASQKRASVVAVFWYSFIERGTQAHVIKPKRAKALRFTSGGRTMFSKRVDHPRTAARPFGHKAALGAFQELHVGDELIQRWNNAA